MIFGGIVLNGFGRGDGNEKKNKASVITRETVGMTLLLFSAVLFFITVTGQYVFGSVGVAITAFFVGLAGFLAYPALLLLVYVGFSLTFGKSPVPVKWLVRGGLLVLAVFLIVHLATSVRFADAGYGGYLSACWSAAEETAANGTGGGILLGLVVYPLQALLSPAGAYVLFALLLALSLFYIAMGTPLKGYLKTGGRKRASAGEREERSRAVSLEDVPPPQPRPIPEQDYAPAPAPAASIYTPAVSASAPVRSSRAGDDEYERSRSILFHGDPMSSYRDNLAFDSDSYFNTRARRNGAQGSEAAQTGGSYSERWTESAGSDRAPMPRRIVETRPQEDMDDLNYPQTPSYRAQTPTPAERPRDFYANDVPVERAAPAAEPAPAPAPEATPPVSEYQAPTLREEPPAQRRSLDSAAPEEPVQDREASFRSLFSRPASGRAEVEPTLDEDNAEEPSAFDATLRGRTEDSVRDFGFRGDAEETVRDLGARDRGESARAQETPSALRRTDADDYEEPEESSRVYEAPMPERRSNADLFDDDGDEGDYTESEEPLTSRRDFNDRTVRRGESVRREAASGTSDPEPERPAPQPVPHVYKDYVRPDDTIFCEYDDTVSVPQDEIERNTVIIQETLAGFRVEADVKRVTPGSAVTRYDIDIPANIAVRSVTKHDQEIAMRLHARDGVNIYSNPEAGFISIEVPNKHRATVGLKSVLQAEEYQNAKPTALMFAMGKDVESRPVCGNIVKMKHLLVAGSTGSGKSVCLNAMLVSLICKYSPQDLRLILIDPKKVEFAVYDGLPHLMINEIIADAQKAVMALNWSIKEMERRYLLFEQKTRAGRLVHNLDEYNANLFDGEEKLAKIVVVVDELADLMSVAKKDIEEKIQRLAQKARAAGIHLVLATQRPSVDVITGVIKGNLPTRIAFRVIQEVDSRTILDESGAEKLLGLGDMLYRTEGMYNCCRVQGAYLSSEEVQAAVEAVKANNEAYFDDSIADYINKTGSSEGAGGDDDADPQDVNPMYIKALAIVVKLGSASISLIQRKCSVGYNHAGKIIEWMELMGYISPFDGKAKARTVLLTKEEFEGKYGSLD